MNTEYKVGDIIDTDKYTLDECLELMDIYEGVWVAIGKLKVIGVKDNDKRTENKES